jgi:membrane protease YdiL (CAAX protease family)
VDPLVKQGLKLRDVIPLWRGRGSLLPLLGGALAGVLSFGFAMGYMALLEQQLGFPIPQRWAPPRLVESMSYPWFRVLPVVAAPVIEEILFRGLLYVGIRQALGANWAILLSSLVFTSVHQEYGFGAIFAVGAACAWIYEKTGLLSAAMALHAVHNLMTVTFKIG